MKILKYLLNVLQKVVICHIKGMKTILFSNGSFAKLYNLKICNEILSQILVIERNTEIRIYNCDTLEFRLLFFIHVI